MKTGLPLTAVTYRRVSTEDQIDNTSLAVQRDDCRCKAESLHATILEECADEGISGGWFLARPGLQRALSLIESGQAQLLICYNISRLSRDRKHQAIIKEMVEAAGGRLVFCDTNFEDTPEGDLMFGIVGSFADYERQVIKTRMAKGRRRRATEGMQPCRAFRPYGYLIVKKVDVLMGHYLADRVGQYVIIEDEARWVRQIFQRYAEGDSLREICRWLNAEGVATPRQGEYWRPSTIKRIFHNPVYKGQAAFGRLQTRNDERRLTEGFRQPFTLHPTPPENHVFIPAPALVDEAIWEECQRLLASNQDTKSGNPGRRFLLSGLLRCPLCGRAMRGSKRNRKHRGGTPYVEYLYACPDSRASRNPGGRVCNPKPLDGTKAEALVLQGITAAARYPALAEAALIGYKRAHKSERDTAAELARLQGEIVALEAREKATVEAQIHGIEAGASPALYAEIFADIRAKRSLLTSRMEALQGEDERVSQLEPATTAAQIAEAMAAVEEALHSPDITPAEKQGLLVRVIEKIEPVEEGLRLHLKPVASHKDQTVARISTLCPPAAATSKARLTCAWPFTSRKSFSNSSVSGRSSVAS